MSGSSEQDDRMAEKILANKLQEISQRGPLQVSHKGSGRFGLTIEAALGIPQNSSKAADFMGSNSRQRVTLACKHSSPELRPDM